MEPEDIKTYVDNICSQRYAGLAVEPTRAALQELHRHGKDLQDIIELLEQGRDAPRKRKAGTIERWLERGGETWNAVIVKEYNAMRQEDVWVLTHVGRFK